MFKSIKTKLIALVVLIILMVTAILGIISLQTLRSAYDESLVLIEKEMRANYDGEIKGHVEIIVSELEGINNQIKKGIITKSQGKELAADVIRDARYGESGYFWVDTVDGINVVLLGNKEVEGTNRIDLEDANGTQFIQALISEAKQGGGYTEYYFPKPGETKASLKRGYSQLYEPFDWVIGTGNYIDDIGAAIQTKKDTFNQKYQANAFKLTVVIIISIGLGGILAFIVSATLVNPIKQLLSYSKKIAKNNIDVDIEINRKDEIGALAKGYQTMIDNLNNTMMSIYSASDQVAVGSEQVSDSSMSLSQGATEQASSIEELTASIEEISSQTKQNAANAQNAKEMATSAQQYAEIGNHQMADMLEAMKDINDSSQNISKIIKVIDDIAFQTNILALNAAVEAARAGQHGRGFAVVAEEVRNLAGKSANAAKETTDLIERSMSKVKGGMKIANETAEALNKIVEGVEQAAELVGDIAVASNEQSLGVEQINQGLSQISDVVQTTSATAEETAAASEELSEQANMLKSQVAKFKLKQSQSDKSDQESVLDPELLKLLGNMEIDETDKIENQRVVKPISLSDSDFEKY